MKIDHIKTLEDLKMAKANFYGPKGELKGLQNQIKSASSEQKVEIGKKINKLKRDAEINFEKAMENIKLIAIEEKIKSEWVDVTVPVFQKGSMHPLTLITNRLQEWLINNSYCKIEGSEIETEEYNFERLNLDKKHPARDMQDSLYIDEKNLLRTHNTGLTARALELNINKETSIFSLGAVYRNDDDDQTHSHQFMQCDIVSVGYLTFPNLIWTLKSLLSYVFETDIEIRMRPSYFPFTEPSVEVDILYKENWIEVLGAGMLHRNVLKSAGYTNKMNGFAAGIGIERLAMIKYGIKDIREFYTNDDRFLSQFQEVF